MGKKMRKLDIEKLNIDLQEKSPAEIIAWAIEFAEQPLVTTNFRPYEVAILYACTQVKNDLKVIWCDTGYNTPNTYKHANELIESLSNCAEDKSFMIRHLVKIIQHIRVKCSKNIVGWLLELMGQISARLRKPGKLL